MALPLKANGEIDWENYTYCEICLAVKTWNHFQDPAWRIRLRKFIKLVKFEFELKIRWL